jgi:nucleotide-binding universal stress UspA family protein
MAEGMAKLFRRILVPYDFSAPAKRALGVAADLAAANRGRLVVLHAIAPFYPAAEGTPWIPPDDLVAAERRRLAALVARVAERRGIKAETRVVIGHPYERIMDAAKAADAIVMATAGRTGLTHLLIGSVAEKIVRHSPVPVLTLRPARTRRRARR